MHLLEIYLEELSALRASRAVTKATSGYPALANRFNAIGHPLKPWVRCLRQRKNRRAGLPGGGLFTPGQLKHTDKGEPLIGLLMARGVIGVKSPGEELAAVADSEDAPGEAAAQPHKPAAALGERLTEYLKHVMLHPAVLNNPRGLTFFLASYACNARVCMEAANDLPALTAIRTALEVALGKKSEAEKGEHFTVETILRPLESATMRGDAGQW